MKFSSRRPFMDPEEVMTLFDSYWFCIEIFKNPQQTPNLETNPHHQNQETKPKPKPKISKPPTLHVRSKSEQLISSMPSFNSDQSLSPISVLSEPHGRQVQEEEPRVQPPVAESEKGMTKSLSNLEFEELKGFMDLGFVFSEEDVNSSLVEIIPGLQRFGKKGTKWDEISVSRPYLSEAWEVWERERREKPLMDWRFPALGDEIDMKDSLKWWAHTVASTVRC